MSLAGYSPLVIYPDIADIDLRHYKTGLKTFIDKCSLSLSRETAFYSFGKVSTPGVSDLDLLMIVRDEECQKARQIAHEIILSSGLLYYLFSHEPVIVPKSMVPHLYFLHTLENCIHVLHHEEYSYSPDEVKRYIKQIYTGQHDQYFEIKIRECLEEWRQGE